MTVDRGFSYGWTYSSLLIISSYWVTDTAKEKPSAEECLVPILLGHRLSKLRYFRLLPATPQVSVGWLPYNRPRPILAMFFWLHYLLSYNLLTSIVYVIHSFIKIKHNIIVCKAAVMPLVKFHSFWLCCIKLDNGRMSLFLQVLYTPMVLSFDST